VSFRCCNLSAALALAQVNRCKSRPHHYLYQTLRIRQSQIRGLANRPIATPDDWPAVEYSMDVNPYASPQVPPSPPNRPPGRPLAWISNPFHPTTILVVVGSLAIPFLLIAVASWAGW
jgi:hypothetical protein